MNTVILTGNLGADPESFFTPEGTQIVTFPFAFRSTKDKTSWIKITVFSKTAEVAAKYLHKGARVGVLGILDQDKWEAEGLDIPIIGIMDLVEEDSDGTIIITENKTSGKAYSDNQIDQNLQLTIYQIAARLNGYRDRNILLRIDCLIKTMTPKFQSYYSYVCKAKFWLYV